MHIDLIPATTAPGLGDLVLPQAACFQLCVRLKRSVLHRALGMEPIRLSSIHIAHTHILNVFRPACVQLDGHYGLRHGTLVAVRQDFGQNPQRCKDVRVNELVVSLEGHHLFNHHMCGLGHHHRGGHESSAQSVPSPCQEHAHDVHRGEDHEPRIASARRSSKERQRPCGDAVALLGVEEQAEHRHGDIADKAVGHPNAEKDAAADVRNEAALAEVLRRVVFGRQET
mmetsp:Transcript_71130/g.205977  ORF Transcript_71130/g.205977 Transcript_71130/m.205977 type:complete len:227 (+) Transcript_71130:3166-3846(+)